MADVSTIEVPDIGDFEDVPVIEVHVAAGDTIAEEDPLVTLESDKATMDVPASAGGVVEEVLLKVGDTASQGTPVVRLAGGSNGDAPAGAEPGAAGTPEAETAVQAETEAAPETQAQAPPAPKPVQPQADSGGENGGPVYASPSVRRLARSLGVDLAQVTGSGRKDRIVPEDVKTFADGGGALSPSKDKAPAAGGGPGLDLLPWPTVDYAKFGEIERVPLSRIGKLSAANLARNWVYIPHVTHNEEADVSDLEAFRKQLNAEQSDVKVTMVALLLKAAAATLQAFPKFNASLDGDELVLKSYFNIGFAADTPNGLVVPVVRDVEAKGLLALAGEIGELSGKARAGKLGPAEMNGGTFTISSLGGIGGTSFSPIVNAPEVAILGVVRSVMKPVWDGAAFVPRLMLPLSLSYDHRVIDGALAARFAAHLARTLTDLRRALL